MFNVIILCIASMLSYVSKEMVYPIIPLYLTNSLMVAPSIIGLVEGISKSISSLLKFYSGYFSDKKDKHKEFIIIGFFGSFLHKLLLIISSNWIGVLFSKIVDGLGKSVRNAPRDAMISYSGISSGKVFGIQRTFDKLGSVIGILIAYYFISKSAYIDYKQIFIFATIPMGLGFVLLFLLKKEQPRKIINVDLKRFNLKIQLFFLIVFISSLGNSTKSFLLLKASSNGISASNVIILYLIANITSFLLAYPFGQLCDKFSKEKLIAISYFLFGLTYLSFAFFSNFLVVIFLFILYGIFIALISISVKSFIIDNISMDMRATALGINECLIGLASLPATIISGFLWTKYGSSAPFYFGGIMGIISFFLVCFYLKNFNKKINN